MQCGDLRYLSLRITNTRSPSPIRRMKAEMLSPSFITALSRRMGWPRASASAQSRSTISSRSRPSGVRSPQA